MCRDADRELVDKKIQRLLWPFALELYQADGMERVCLLLQDKYNINITLLLWAIWLDHLQRPVASELIQLARERTEIWHCRLILPLRRLRRAVPRFYGFAWLRSRLGQLEIKAEEKELKILERVANHYWLENRSIVNHQSESSYLQLVLQAAAEEYIPEIRQIYLSAIVHKSAVRA